MNYAEMTIEQLESKNADFMARKMAIISEQHSLRSILNKKLAEQKAQETFEAMSDAEKEVLKQTVMASGIESKEQVQGIK